MRYHVVSIAAFFLALSLGVLLGSTSLSERLLSSVGDERSTLSAEAAGLREENRTLQAELVGADRFGSAVGSQAVRGRLDGRSVVMITTWDVPVQERDAMRGLLVHAGANVTGVVRLTDRVADPGQADQLRRVVTGLLPAGVQLPATADPGTLVGGLLGSLTLLDPQTAQPQVSPQERASAVGGLAGGGFAQLDDRVAPAELAVVLTGGRYDGNGVATSTIANLATQLDHGGGGAVLAGKAGSATGSGPVGVARTDPATAPILSTVDNADTAFGRVAVILALAEQQERRAGHYGIASNAQDVVPGARD